MAKELIFKIPASIEDYNYQMTNLSKDETNLPMVIWIESNTRTSQHDTPSLKFANSYSNKQLEIDLIPVSIAQNPEILIQNPTLNISQSDLNILIEWIKRHYDDLIKVWTQDITPSQFVIKINEQ